MISFLISLGMLLLGFIIYGKVVEKCFGISDKKTPAYTINDGIDFVPMPLWKVFLIQLLNIAGTGPIFGALSGAIFGPIVYFWIVLGCIFAGGVHDYMSGMLSLRNNGVCLTEVSGKYLGKEIKFLMNIFSIVLLILFAVIFTVGPADLLENLTHSKIKYNVWIIIIMAYYFLATFLPVDKIVGKMYPIFAICFIFMCVGVMVSMLINKNDVMPEIWNNFKNMHAEKVPVFPFMFITVACGAISGFHSTQSPIMARCIKSEKEGRIVFYGAMIIEGVIALVWAAAGVTYYENSQQLLEAGGGCSDVVYNICTTSLGKTGSIIAMLGVIICPISSGDTAYRSVRLMLSDWLKIDQSNFIKRLGLTAILLSIGALVCRLNYNMIWRYGSWANQTLAMIVLWTATTYLKREKRNFWITLIPAMWMTAVTITYFVLAPECLGFLFD